MSVLNDVVRFRSNHFAVSGCMPTNFLCSETMARRIAYELSGSPRQMEAVLKKMKAGEFELYGMKVEVDDET